MHIVSDVCNAHVDTGGPQDHLRPREGPGELRELLGGLAGQTRGQPLGPWLHVAERVWHGMELLYLYTLRLVTGCVQ